MPHLRLVRLTHAAAAAGLLLCVAGCSDADAGRTAEATPVPEVETLVEQQGTGGAVTTPFTAEARWDVAYTYDCTGQPGGAGAFTVHVQDVSGRRINVIADNQGAEGSKENRWPHAGTYALDVETACSWTLKVTG